MNLKQLNYNSMKLIDKDALLAEIEKCVYRCNEKKHSCPVNTQVEAICDNKINAYNEIISHINTLEVKEVDLEKEIQNSIYDHFFDLNGIAIAGCTAYATVEDMVYIAKHFFELGINTQKDLTV